MNAFRAIGRAVGATRLAYHPDFIEDGFLEAFWGGCSFAECAAVLERSMGPPQPSIDAIDAAIADATDHGVPRVWFLEDIAACDGHFDQISKARAATESVQVPAEEGVPDAER
jgi:hypothetical protein